jgi:hypothetical protein
LDSARLPGGVGRFRVEASDGAQSTRAQSDPILVSSKPPVVRIANPADGLRIQWGQPLNRVAEVLDPQEAPLADASIIWSNAYRSLGSGPAIEVSDLEVGVNVITLTVTNAAGITAFATATVVVGDSIQLPGPILASTPSDLAWTVEGDVTTPQTGTLLVTNIGGGGAVTFDAASTEPWLTVDGAASTSLATPASLAISVDPSVLPELVASMAEIRITPAGAPAATVSVPVTLLKGSLVTGQMEVPEPSTTACASGVLASLVALRVRCRRRGPWRARR